MVLQWWIAMFRWLLSTSHRQSPIWHLRTRHQASERWRHSAAACCTIYWCRHSTLHTSPHPHSIPITPAAPVLPIVDHCARGKIWNIAIKFPKQEALAPRSRNRVEHKGENGCWCWRNEKVMQNRHHFYRVRNVGVFHSSLSLLNWFVKSFMFYIKLLDIRHNNASKQRSSQIVGISVNHSLEYKLRTKKIIQLVV